MKLYECVFRINWLLAINEASRNCPEKRGHFGKNSCFLLRISLWNGAPNSLSVRKKFMKIFYITSSIVMWNLPYWFSVSTVEISRLWDQNVHSFIHCMNFKFNLIYFFEIIKDKNRRDCNSPIWTMNLNLYQICLRTWDEHICDAHTPARARYVKRRETKEIKHRMKLMLLKCTCFNIFSILPSVSPI